MQEYISESNDMRNYHPIENYGGFGDFNAVALIGLNESISFMCFPEVDSPSIIASMLDKEYGGFFQFVPVNEETRNKQLYLSDTKGLPNSFLSEEGEGGLTDFMPVEEVMRGIAMSLDSH